MKCFVEVEKDSGSPGRVTVRFHYALPGKKPLTAGTQTYYTEVWEVIEPFLKANFDYEAEYIEPDDSWPGPTLEELTGGKP